MKLTSRAIHRDLGYFYVGLILSFALSGIMMNHRDSWHPEKYTLNITEIQKKTAQRRFDYRRLRKKLCKY